MKAKQEGQAPVSRRRRPVVLFALPLLGMFSVAPTPLYADVKLDKDGKAKLQADFRLRFESDFDSRRADGRPRDDRDRLRIRGRLGMTWAPGPKVTLGFRLRTGSTDSQQSPHITIADFDDNPRGDADALLDKWYVRFSGKGASLWAGRNSFPFWKQNELFWDDDVTPAGVAASYEVPAGGGKLQFNGGFFALPDGGVDFNGRMGAGQAIFSGGSDPFRITLAGGFFGIRGERGARHLRNGNGARDYSILTGSVQARLKVGQRPLTLGGDVMQNVEDYSPRDPDPFTASNHDQTSGFVLSILLGALQKRGDWQAGYYYAYLETLAVHASYAQDDWVRWGSATQTDSSDLKGHELRFVIALSRKANLMARLYLVEAITSVQDGNRFRLDFNYSF